MGLTKTMTTMDPLVLYNHIKSWKMCSHPNYGTFRKYSFLSSWF